MIVPPTDPRRRRIGWRQVAAANDDGDAGSQRPARSISPGVRRNLIWMTVALCITTMLIAAALRARMP
jgi:hypothetical protein